MTKEILWLDNDPSYLTPYVDALQYHGYKVTITTSLLAAEELVEFYGYDLLILDVMIPTKSPEEEKVYETDETDYNLKSGLVFYKRMREMLNSTNTQVLVMTVKLDQDIVDEFLNAGLPQECFTTKMRVRTIDDFVNKVRHLIGDASQED